MLLLRHASAGERLAEPSLDAVRPLDDDGRITAQVLVDGLRGLRIHRIVSSPLARSVETVEELARSLDLEIELRPELAPGASRSEIVALLDALPDATVACTHREVFEELFEEAVTCEKGAGWILERDHGCWRAAEYVPEPRVFAAARSVALA